MILKVTFNKSHENDIISCRWYFILVVFHHQLFILVITDGKLLVPARTESKSIVVYTLDVCFDNVYTALHFKRYNNNVVSITLSLGDHIRLII